MSVIRLPASDPLLTNANGFQQIRIPGVESAGHHAVQTGIVYKGQIYLGLISYPDGIQAAGHARIVRYLPAEDAWDLVHSQEVESQFVASKDGERRLPLELGFRGMAIVDDCLYASLVSLHKPAVLISETGDQFKTMPGDRPSGTPLGPLAEYKGKLFAAQIGTMSLSTDKGAKPHCWVYVCENPAQGVWQTAAPSAFNDENNQVVHGLCVYDHHLYALIGNGLTGFQIWKTDAVGNAPYQWQLVVERGAQRFTLNNGIPSFAVFNGALYIGTGAPATEPLADNQAAAEILRFTADDRWELVMGNPRFSPHGLQIPASAHSAGFDDKEMVSVSQMAASNDYLYASLNTAPEGGNRVQLWRSADGNEWEMTGREVIGDGRLGCNRLLLPTPIGLLVAGLWQAGGAGDSLSIWIAAHQ